jgi:hypothetical protein
VHFKKLLEKQFGLAMSLMSAVVLRRLGTTSRLLSPMTSSANLSTSSSSTLKLNSDVRNCHQVTSMAQNG